MSDTINQIIEISSEVTARKKISLELLHAVNDENSDAKDLAKILSRDQFLTAHLIKIANSAYYGLERQIESVVFAITMLGFLTVRTLALNALLAPEDGATEMFWQIAYKSATTASLIAPSWNYDNSIAFSTTLLHNIGNTLLYNFDKKRYYEIIKTTRELPYKDAREYQYAKENELYNLTAPVVGAALLEKWKFPTSITHAIAAQEKMDPVNPLEQIMAFSAELAWGIEVPTTDWLSSITPPPPLAEQNLSQLVAQVKDQAPDIFRL
jgi:HD-like signal output (HDOD) protein